MIKIDANRKEGYDQTKNCKVNPINLLEIHID
jgi:hypothetical protein